MHLLLVEMHLLLVVSLFLVAMPGATSSFLLPVEMRFAPSSFLILMHLLLVAIAAIIRHWRPV